MMAAIFLTGCFDSGGGGSGSSDIDFGDNDPNLVLCMGDSITEGGNGEEGPPWPERLTALSGKRTINEGRGGELSSEGESRIVAELEQYKPGYVVIFYGANDAIFGFGVEHVMAQINDMIHAARLNKTVPIVCTVLPTYDARGFANGLTAEYSARIRVSTAAQGVACADVRADFEGRRELILSDGLHPNDAGLDVIALNVNDQLP
jgi:lysophospholipase L1-like esterase